MWGDSRGRQEKHNGGEKKRPNAPTPYIRTPLHALIYAPYGVLVMRSGSAGPDTHRTREQSRGNEAETQGDTQTDRVEGYTGRDTQERGHSEEHSEGYSHTAHRQRTEAHGEPRDTRDTRVSQMCIARPAGLSVGHLGARGARGALRGLRGAAHLRGFHWCAGGCGVRV